MKTLRLHSCLAESIQDFINLRRLSGTDYQGQAQLLGYFDRFVFKQGIKIPRITQQITDDYLGSLLHLAPRTRLNRFSVVRQLCQYLAQNDHLNHIPEPLKTISSRGNRKAYIYTMSEIQNLMEAASTLLPENSLRPRTYKTFIGLLYSTGIRIGEALALNLEHFHPTNKCLYIAEGKFRKDRWVPLSISTCTALEQYLTRRTKVKPYCSDSPIFINNRARRLHQCTVNQTFHFLLRKCEIAYSKSTGPRIHDFRHSFAVHRLLDWYRDRKDVNARLPWLSTYMGHVDIHSTQVYLQATTELIEQVNHRFHNHYINQVKSKGGENVTSTSQVY